MLTFVTGLRRYIYNSSLLYHVRIFIALVGVTAVPWWIDQPKLTIPLTLGVVAAALTDLDDRLAGRLRNLFITLICFLSHQPLLSCYFLILGFCPWPDLFNLWLYSAGCLRPTLCHHRLWRIINCHLHHVGYFHVPYLVSATPVTDTRCRLV